MNDLTGIGEIGGKIIDAVATFFGKAFEPAQIKRLAHANAEASIIQAKADAEKLVIMEQAKVELPFVAQRAVSRLLHREVERQANIESVIARALQFEPQESNDEKVTNEWMSRFFEGCQDVREEQVQDLWAKILAEETASPGKFSRHTLSTLKSFDKDAALIFGELCKFAMSDTFGTKYMPHISPHNWPESPIGLSELLDMQAIGVVCVESGHNINFRPNDEVRYGGKTYFVQWTADAHSTMRMLGAEAIGVPCLFFTRAGEQLSKLVESTFDNDFFQAASRELAGIGYRLSDMPRDKPK